VEKLAQGQRPARRVSVGSHAAKILEILLGRRITDISKPEMLEIMEAARECLPALRQSLESRQIGSLLLRPAEGPTAQPDTLLRPALPHASVESAEQLLHPTDTP
jgi:hypothetical protein